MGYCIYQLKSEFSMKKENFGEALKAIKALVAQDHKKTGMSIKDGQVYERHFSWTENDEILSSETIFEAFRAWRWEVEKEGDINSICFQGEKLGDDIHFFKAIAPFVEAGSYIEMRGEDGNKWRWVFDGETCKAKKW